MDDSPAYCRLSGRLDCRITDLAQQIYWRAGCLLFFEELSLIIRKTLLSNGGQLLDQFLLIGSMFSESCKNISCSQNK